MHTTRSAPERLVSYDYAVIRAVPRVERGEFVNVGIVLSCSSQNVLEAGIEVNAARLLALHPALDIGSLNDALAALTAVCRGGADAGPLGCLSVRERFHWLVAPRSSVVQMSPVHTGRTADLEAELERLMDRMVRMPDGTR